MLLGGGQAESATLQEANYQLGQVLIELGRKTDAKVFLDRAAKLVAYIDLVPRNNPCH